MERNKTLKKLERLIADRWCVFKRDWDERKDAGLQASQASASKKGKNGSSEEEGSAF